MVRPWLIDIQIYSGLLSRIIAIVFVCLLFSKAAPGQNREFKGLGSISDTTYINYLIQRADSLYHGKNQQLPDSAIVLLNEALNLSLSSFYAQGIRNAARLLREIHYLQYNDAQAIYYLNVMIPWCDSVKNRKELFDAYCQKGSSYLEGFQNFNMAFESYIKSLRYATGSADSAMIYGNISALMLSANQYSKGLEFANKGLALKGKTKSVTRSLYSNKAALYSSLKDSIQPQALYDSALLYATSVNEKADIYIRKIFFFDMIGNHDAMLSEFALIRPLLDSDSLSSKIKAKALMAGGITYLNTGNYKRSESYLLKANNLSIFLGQDKRVLDHLLSTLYYKIKDYKKAYDLHVLVHQTDDSIRSAEVQFTINELETKYRTVQKDQVITRQEAQISNSQKRLYLTMLWGGGSIALLIITSLLLGIRYYYQKQKNQQLETEQTVARLHALIEGEEKERTRLSHELHDGVNSTLAATTSYLHTIEHRHPEMKTDDFFMRAKELLASSSSEIRSIAHNLAPHILIQHGLFYAIEAFCNDLFPEAIHVDILCSGNEQKLPRPTRLFIYRTVQELLHNVYKHAQATEVDIHAEVHDHYFSLGITDNGIGLNDQEKSNGIGLQHIRERVKVYEGKIEIGTNGHSGTRVYLCIPLEQKNTH